MRYLSYLVCPFLWPIARTRRGAILQAVGSVIHMIATISFIMWLGTPSR